MTVINGQDRYVVLSVFVGIAVFDRYNKREPFVKIFSRKERDKAERLAKKLNQTKENQHATN